MSKLTLEQEMKLWEVRGNDKFGTLLKDIEHIVAKVLDWGVDQFGISHNPIRHMHAVYCLDGNEKVIVKQLKNFLDEYDFNEYENINTLLKNYGI